MLSPLRTTCAAKKQKVVFERVDKFIVKSTNTSNKLQHNATVSIRGIIIVHIAPRDTSPRAMAMHQSRLVINTNHRIDMFDSRIMISL